MQDAYVWIVTRADDQGKTAEVVRQCKTQADAKAFVDHGTNGPNLGYEGLVRRDLYPVGKTFAIDE